MKNETTMTRQEAEKYLGKTTNMCYEALCTLRSLSTYIDQEKFVREFSALCCKTEGDLTGLNGLAVRIILHLEELESKVQEAESVKPDLLCYLVGCADEAAYSLARRLCGPERTTREKLIQVGKLDEDERQYVVRLIGEDIKRNE